MARLSDYELIGRFQSRSNPRRAYEVKKHRRTGAISCNCRAWVFAAAKGGKRECWHIAAATIAESAGNSLDTSTAI